PDTKAPVVHHAPGVRCGDAGEHGDQCGLSTTVAADHADTVLRVDTERHLVEEYEWPVGQGHVLKIDQIHHLPLWCHRHGARATVGSDQEEVACGLCDAFHVQAVGTVVLLGFSVGAQLVVAGHPEGELAMAPVPQ